MVIEESFIFDEPYWPNDDLWAAHYLLLTGYDDAQGTFTGQDSFRGANQVVPYAVLDEGWKIFNRVYMLVYPLAQEKIVRSLLGSHWDVDADRQAALNQAQLEIEINSEDAFAWFNLGTNLVYFEGWAEAAQAYDTARSIGLPQRMLRYQFGPFFAYFHSNEMEDLLALTDYALQITPNAEEAWLWRGWALYRQGDSAGAISAFREAYWFNTNSQDAQYALDFMGAKP